MNPTLLPFRVRAIEDLPAPDGKAVLVRATLELPMAAESSSPVAALRFAGLARTVAALTERGAVVTVFGDTHPPGAERTDRGVPAAVRALGATVFSPPSGSVEDSETIERLTKEHDAFVNDSFQWSYLALPSLSIPPEHLPSAAGRGLVDDLRIGSALLDHPERPFAAVLGGANSLLRLHGLRGLTLRADTILVGGAMSLPLLEATGKRPSGPLPDWFLEECRAVFGLAERVQHQIHLPLDLVVRRPDGDLEVVAPADAEGEVVDIGPLTARRFAELVHGADTVAWAGALGRVEEAGSAAGTIAVAAGLAGGTDRTLVIGGDSLASVLRTEGRLGGHVRLVTATDSLLELLKNGDLPALPGLRGSPP